MTSGRTEGKLGRAFAHQQRRDLDVSDVVRPPEIIDQVRCRQEVQRREVRLARQRAAARRVVVVPVNDEERQPDVVVRVLVVDAGERCLEVFRRIAEHLNVHLAVVQAVLAQQLDGLVLQFADTQRHGRSLQRQPCGLATAPAPAARHAREADGEEWRAVAPACVG